MLHCRSKREYFLVPNSTRPHSPPAHSLILITVSSYKLSNYFVSRPIQSNSTSQIASSFIHKVLCLPTSERENHQLFRADCSLWNFHIHFKAAAAAETVDKWAAPSNIITNENGGMKWISTLCFLSLFFFFEQLKNHENPTHQSRTELREKNINFPTVIVRSTFSCFNSRARESESILSEQSFPTHIVWNEQKPFSSFIIPPSTKERENPKKRSWRVETRLRTAAKAP